MISTSLLPVVAEIVLTTVPLGPNIEAQKLQAPLPAPAIVDYCILWTRRNNKRYKFMVTYAVNGYSNDFGQLFDKNQSQNQERFEMIKLPNGHWIRGYPLMGKVINLAICSSPEIWLITSTGVYVWDNQSNQLILTFIVPHRHNITEFRATTRHHEVINKNGNFAGLLSFRGNHWHIIPYQGQHKGHAVTSTENQRVDRTVITLSSGKKVAFYPLTETFSDL